MQLRRATLIALLAVGACGTEPDSGRAPADLTGVEPIDGRSDDTNASDAGPDEPDRACVADPVGFPGAGDPIVLSDQPGQNVVLDLEAFGGAALVALVGQTEQDERAIEIRIVEPDGRQESLVLPGFSSATVASSGELGFALLSRQVAENGAPEFVVFDRELRVVESGPVDAPDATWLDAVWLDDGVLFLASFESPTGDWLTHVGRWDEGGATWVRPLDTTYADATLRTGGRRVAVAAAREAEGADFFVMDGQGNRIGEVVGINDADVVQDPSVARLDDAWVIGYRTLGIPGESSVHAVAVDDAGALVAPRRVVSGSGVNASFSALASGGRRTVVAWQSNTPDGIIGRVLTDDLEFVGEPFSLAPTDPVGAMLPALVWLGDRFALTWTSWAEASGYRTHLLFGDEACR